MSRGQKPYMDWESIGRSRKWLDYGLLCMYESAAMILVGADGFELDTNTDTLSWSGFSIYSPISGKSVSVSGGSTSINDGDVIYIRNVEHPFENETKNLTTGSPNDKGARRPTNLFLGLRDGPSIHLFPSGGGAGVAPPRFYESKHIYIADFLDGATPPTALSTYSSGNGKAQIRKFGVLSSTNVMIPWEAPEDMDSSAQLRFRVLGLLSDSAMNGEGVVFGLKGYSIGDGDSISQSWGAEVTVVASTTASTGSRAISNLSSPITIPDLAADEMVMLHLERKLGHAQDTYADPFALTGLKLQWTREAIT